MGVAFGGPPFEPVSVIFEPGITIPAFGRLPAALFPGLGMVTSPYTSMGPACPVYAPDSPLPTTVTPATDTPLVPVVKVARR